MVIVLIKWRIKPSESAVGAFKNWWREHAEIADRCGLVGEFLSEPVPEEQLPYASDDLAPASGEFWPFVNVGLWRDEEAFRSQVAQYFKDDEPPQDFEAARRTRTVLLPREWRLGEWNLADLADGDGAR